MDAEWNSCAQAASASLCSHVSTLKVRTNTAVLCCRNSHNYSRCLTRLSNWVRSRLKELLREVRTNQKELWKMSLLLQPFVYCIFAFVLLIQLSFEQGIALCSNKLKTNSSKHFRWTSPVFSALSLFYAWFNMMVVAIVFLYAYDAAHLYNPPAPNINIFVVLYGHIVTATQSLCASLSVL